jgi:hypothetical protein
MRHDRNAKGCPTQERAGRGRAETAAADDIGDAQTISWPLPGVNVDAQAGSHDRATD